MLRKLLKYDLRRVFKFLSVFYLLALFFSVLTRIFSVIGDSLFLTILSSITGSTAISMMFSILINCFMRSWVLFKSALYGDESYLSHTLPITKGTHYASKAITAFLSVFVSMAVIIGTLLISYYSKETVGFLKFIIDPVAAYFDLSVFGVIAILLIILFLEFISSLQCGFTGIILGHRFHQRKVLFSVLFGFLFYILSQILVLVVMLIAALINPGVFDLFTSSELTALPSDIGKLVTFVGAACYFVFSIIGYVLNTYLLKKGVDVE